MIIVNGTNLYVGGGFSNVNNNGSVLSAADYIAKWNGTSWSALGSNGAGNGALNNYVNTIAVRGTNLYVGGRFADVNNNGTALPAADYIAKWNGTSWSALGSNGAGNGSLRNGPLTNSQSNAIAISGTNLYAGGFFINVNNNGKYVLAADYMAVYGLGAIPTPTPTVTASPTRTMTQTSTITMTPTGTATPSATITMTETITASPTETMTATPTEPPTGTMTATVTLTETPTATPTETVTPTPTP